MVSLAQARTVLTRHGWLAEQPETFQNDLLRRCVLMHFRAGDVIFRIGDPPGGVYGIVDGAVTVTLAPPVAVPRLLHIGLAGSWIGEGPFLVREPRRVEMHATVETWAMYLPLEAMDRIAGRDPLAVRRFTKILMNNLDTLVRAFYEIQNPDEDRRIALALLRIATAPGSRIPLSQAELGVMAGVSRKQVNATLQRFAAAGHLAKGYRSITLRNVRALKALAYADE